MSEERFVYVTYIATTPDKVWAALTQGEITKQYWGKENVSDWRPGSEWRHQMDDANRTPRVIGQVVESIPNRRLVLSWADPQHAADRSQHSRVTMDIEVADDMVRLTVVHDQFPAGSDQPKSIAKGWPLVLSSMKSLLETGRALNVRCSG